MTLLSKGVFKRPIRGLFFFIFVFSVQLRIKSLPMTGFNSQTSGVGSNRSNNWATTTALLSKGVYISRLIIGRRRRRTGTDEGRATKCLSRQPQNDILDRRVGTQTWTLTKLSKQGRSSGSPGLVVMGDDSCRKVVGSNPGGWTFFTLICCKNVCLKRMKINENEAGLAHF